MKYNDNIYYYPPLKKFKRGGHSSSVFVVKSENEPNKSNESYQFLVEAGVSVGGWGKKILNKIKQDGIDIGKTMGIFITHPHQDHIAGINFYQNAIKNNKNNENDMNNVPVYFNNKFKRFLEDPKIADKYFSEEIGYFERDLWWPGLIIKLVFRYLWGNRLPHRVTGIEEGQIFPLGDNSNLEVIMTPGHAPSHTSFLINCSDGKKVLLSGDLLSFQEDNNGDIQSIASINNPASIYEKEIETLNKLTEMVIEERINVLFSSHYGYFEGRELIRDYLQSSLDRLLRLKNSIFDALSKKPMKIKELTQKVINQKNYLSGYGARKSSVYVILKHLMKIGKVECDPKTRIFNTITE
ncbi:MAG: MBL fold metallo-hydrolase [Promethearchaeota archaeon]